MCACASGGGYVLFPRHRKMLKIVTKGLTSTADLKRPLTTLGVVAVGVAAVGEALCIMAGTVAAFPVSHANLADAARKHPANSAQTEKWSLAQFPCTSAYFGSGGAPDYPSALKCFRSNGMWGFVALMYLNGEGTPRNLNRAAAALKRWKQNNSYEFGSYNSDAAASLGRAIERCRNSARQACPRVDYCKQLAMSTLEMNFCAADDDDSAESNLDRRLAAIGSTLGSRDRESFERVITAFKAYEMSELQRGYAAAGDATIRVLAGFGQKDFVRSDFVKLLSRTIQARQLAPATGAAYRTMDANLDRELRRDFRETTDAWREELKDSKEKDIRDKERSYIEDYKKAAQESELRWIRFRDSSAELASFLYRSHGEHFDPAVSMKAFVTKLRIAELRYNPIGPESN